MFGPASSYIEAENRPRAGMILFGLALFGALLFQASHASAGGMTPLPAVTETERRAAEAITTISYNAESPHPWGHHSGRYDWNHYWTLITPEIFAPPRPWRWSPFTMTLRRFPFAVPHHHMSVFLSGWSYDYRANATLLINLFPDYVIRRVTTESRALNFSAYQQALGGKVGETFTWTDGNLRGAVTTTREGWSGRRYCREFRQDIYIDDRPQQTLGTVCRERGGDWEIAPNQ